MDSLVEEFGHPTYTSFPVIAARLSWLPPERQAALREGLAALMQAALAARGGRAFGICRDCRHLARDARGPGAHFCRLLEQPLEDAEAGQICQEQQAA